MAKQQSKIEACMKEEGFSELLQRYTDYLKDLITHPEKIKKTPEVNREYQKG